MLFSYALATIVALFVLFVVLSLILMFIGNGAEPDPRAQRPRIITWPDGSVRLPRGQSRYTGVQPTPIPVTTTTSQQCLSQSPYQQQQQQPMHRPQPQPQPQPQGAPVVDPRYSHAYPPVLTPMDAQLAEMEAMREYERMMNPMAVTEDPRPGPTFWELLGDAAWGVICAMRRRARIWLGLRQKVPPPIPNFINGRLNLSSPPMDLDVAVIQLPGGTPVSVRKKPQEHSRITTTTTSTDNSTKDMLRTPLAKTTNINTHNNKSPSATSTTTTTVG
ncbi:hypothetical protein Pelo_14986 [Pelomyxa schiedti]|nr:hypothetical protein Pelo_14986 [Pelomyxa schiedti]